ncbi:DEAD/DEAH box helicase [uncultured Phocaeicola sp.]|uniref:DEAD/DEAH box helicase n=1 Tax=uncultured Phocaeicola sp. TaxID=990718 RepID=UPI0014343849|nr:DEAD/DEAH box helicase [uncultured Phocaeicola sp.]GFH98944.1 RNA polymerase-associated protein RapA [Bacteroidaceae bacterium]
MAKNTRKKDDKKLPKVSYYCKPDNLTLKQWQIALRRQTAEKENFAIFEHNTKDSPGYYSVVNSVTKNEYRVVYRGEESVWNYCSCMDFKTSQLGSCKHLEAVKLWISRNHRKIYAGRPSYTSLYLSYKGERKICLRIGTDHEDEFRQLAEPYFTPDGVMRPRAMLHIMDFMREAIRLDNTFRWYDDVLSFIVENRDFHYRKQLLHDFSDKELDQLLKVSLYPYQKEGIRFAFQAGKAIIADEMGLGKTVQAIGTAELMKRKNLIASVLIVCPTSLKYQWKREIERFTGSTVVVVEGNHLARKKLYTSECFYKIVSYNAMSNDIKLLQTLHTDFLIMDEVQRLKNWKTQISRSARHIESEYAVVLSGTPLENKLEELYSVMQFVDQYCLGPYYQFIDQTVVTSDTGKVIGYKNLNLVGEKLKSSLIRRCKKDVALQLPQRMDKILFVPMTKEQREIHDEYQGQVAQLVYKWTRFRFLSEKDRKRLLLFMSQMRMVCDSTYILDQKTRCDTKVDETINILRNVFDSGDEKVVIFSQWERMTRLIAAELDAMDVRYEYLHGGVPSEKRRHLTENFIENPDSRVFISTDAGSTGLNLQVASVLINLDLPWNPAVLEQRIARIFRIGQQRNIQIINLVASGTIEERMLSTLNFKSSLFEGILDNGQDSVFLDDSKLDKIMDSIKIMTETTEGQEEEGADSLSAQDMEERIDRDSAVTEIENDEVSGEKESVLSAGFPDEFEPEEASGTSEKRGVGGTTSVSGGVEAKEDPQELVQQGLSFFSGLARTLQSPQETQKLVDSIVKVDEKTGKTSLNIPVPDKESVVNILNMVGKLLGGK